MGGLGSGTWDRYDTKATVEECPSLDVGKLKRQGVLAPGSRGSLSWTYCGGGESSVRYSVNFVDGLEREFRLYYRWNDGKDLAYSIRLQATEPHLSGLRWWFICPLIKCNVPCARRVTKLYLQGRYFGCRTCHDLTYRSCQESHQEERLVGSVACMREWLDN